MAHTRAMGNHSLQQFLFTQPRKRVESTSRLEGPDPLIILAFEEEVDFWACWRVSFEGRTS